MSKIRGLTGLFREFLPIGYDLTTISSVKNKSEVVNLKVILGTLITLYDDFADRPDKFNPKLLQLLYRLPFEKIELNDAFLSIEESVSLNLAKSLFIKLKDGLSHFPNYNSFIDIFYFDLKQFFLANYYCEQLTKNPNLANVLENQMYLHHNMGIVMAGMIDLMSLEKFNMSELGQARSLFLLGQRAGRISNILSTYEREKQEGDVTNELIFFTKGEYNNFDSELLEIELSTIFQKMNKYKNILSFTVSDYRQGIQALHELHIKFIGII